MSAFREVARRRFNRPEQQASAAMAKLNREDFVIQVFVPPTIPSLEACHRFVN